MKRILLPFFLFIFCCGFSFSQIAGQWVWLHGDSTANSAPNFGTIGLPSPANDPPAVYEPCEWTDKNGNFWLYGGFRVVFYAALWKYDVSANEWTWMKGPSTTNYTGSYGTIGVPSPANNPPNKSYGVTTWTDTTGNLWMFGGLSNIGNGSNDLWKYDIATNEWTWMKGPNIANQIGVYGVQGVPDTANTPGARWECASAWTDSLDNLWLFGGFKAYNDLWKYNIQTNTWTWMKGSNLANQPGVYGTLGVEDSLNTPGARATYSHWMDAKGNFWIFGGTFTPNTPYNDLWRYNIVTNNWTWMGGSNTTGDTGVYGTRCIADSANIPGARFENRAVWMDTNGNFWMFGGGIGGGFNQIWNDLWMYCFKINQWIWISGDTVSSPAGNWGTQGVWSATNKPNGRGGAVSWTDNNGHLYLFGGTTSPAYTTYNDLWEFAIDTSCGSCFQSASPVANFTSSDTTFCSESGKCIDFTDHSGGNPTSWKWFFSGAIPDSSNQQNPTNICYYSVGTYSVTLIVTNAAGMDTLTVYPMITLAAPPPLPTVTLSGDTLFSSHASSYQWYYNGSPITGATDSFYIYSSIGTYSVEISNGTGCNTLSTGFLITSVSPIQSVYGGLTLYPNPAKDEVTIYLNNSQPSSVKCQVSIYNVLGEKVYSVLINGKQEIVNCKSFASGIYFIKVVNEKVNFIGKFVKE